MFNVKLGKCLSNHTIHSPSTYMSLQHLWKKPHAVGFGMPSFAVHVLVSSAPMGQRWSGEEGEMELYGGREGWRSAGKRYVCSAVQCGRVTKEEGGDCALHCRRRRRNRDARRRYEGWPTLGFHTGTSPDSRRNKTETVYIFTFGQLTMGQWFKMQYVCLSSLHAFPAEKNRH